MKLWELRRALLGDIPIADDTLDVVVFKDGFYHDVVGVRYSMGVDAMVLKTELKREWLNGVQLPKGNEAPIEENSRTKEHES